ncbi:hypothetical protein GJ496_010446 [Pomphorhynchus laevis]|nr:hypothetical protein GJ496_010446 [Pomphorhynchus laevis]
MSERSNNSMKPNFPANAINEMPSLVIGKRICFRYFSTNVGQGQSAIDNRVSSGAYQHQLPRGPLGPSRRAGFNGQVVTVFGGTGFIGQAIVSRLCGIGCQVILPYRCDPNYLGQYRLMGELGQINFYPLDSKNPEHIERCIKYSNVVVNALGKHWETRNFSFEDVHVRISGEIAQACRRLNVNRLIHISALNASPNPPSFYLKPSKYLITKYQGEKAVLDAFPSAFIVRPSDVYGVNDWFLHYYYSNVRARMNGSIPAYAKGRKTIKAPVSVHDVTTAITRLCVDDDLPTQSGQYDLFGPKMYYLYDLLNYYLQCTLQDEASVTYMRPLPFLKMILSAYSPVTKMVGLDRLEREFVSDKPTSDLQFSTLGITPKPVTYYWPFMCRVMSRFVNRNYDANSVPDPKCLRPVDGIDVPAASIPSEKIISTNYEGYI